MLQPAAVRAERVELPFPESESGVLPIERSPIMVGLERFELSPHGLRVRNAAFTPQTQIGNGVDFRDINIVGPPKRREPAEVLPLAGSQIALAVCVSLIYAMEALQGLA